MKTKATRQKEPPIAAKRSLEIIAPGWTVGPDEYPFRMEPMAHQREALRKSANRRVFALFWEPRTGKTKVTLDTAGWLWRKERIDRVLIFAPNNCYEVWEEQAYQHLPEWVPVLAKKLDLANMTPKRLAEFEQDCQHHKGLLLVSMNIEGLGAPSGKAEAWAKRFLRGGPALLVVDESQKIRNPSSARSKACHRLAPLASFRRILTGTAIPKGYENLFSQYKFLDPEIIGLRTYTEFKAEYCTMGGFELRQIVGYRQIPRLMQAVAPHTMSVKKADCMELPPQQEVTVHVTFSPEQKQIYQALKDELLVILEEGGLIVSPVAAVKHLRLRQVMSGFYVKQDLETGKEEIIDLPCPRLEALVEECDLAPNKVIVWAEFRHDVTRIVARLTKEKIGAVMCHGGMLTRERDLMIAKWRLPEGPKVIVATPGTMGIGKTLDEADLMIFYSHGYDQENRAQAKERNYSKGQKMPITIKNLVAKGSLDPLIISIAEKSALRSETVHNPALFREWLRQEPG